MSRRRFNAAARERLLGALAAGADVRLAARIAGVGKDAVYDWRKKHPEYAREMDEARDVADERVIHALFTSATKSKNVTAMIFWLKNRRPNEWRDRREISAEIGGRDGGPIEYRAAYEDGDALSPAAEDVSTEAGE